MLQKHSKCEVKAWLCWNLIILPPLRFYLKSNFSKFNRSKNVIFGNFRGSEKLFKKIWANFKSRIYKNLNFWISNIAKNDIFGPFEFAKTWFHVNSEWLYNYQISTKSGLNFIFWKFLEHSAVQAIVVWR